MYVSSRDLCQVSVQDGEVNCLESVPLEDRQWAYVDHEIALAPQYSPDGSKILYIDRDDGFLAYYDRLFLMPPDFSTFTSLTNVDIFDEYPSWSPDGTRIAFVSDRTAGYEGTSDIYIIDLSSEELIRLTYTTRKYEKWPAWSPDGRYVAFVEKSGKVASIRLFDTKTNKESCIRTFLGYISYLDW